MRSKWTVMVAVLAAAAFCLPAAGQTVVSYDADVHAFPGDGQAALTSTGGGAFVANWMGRAAWHSHHGGGDGGMQATGGGIFAANDLDNRGFNLKTTLHYVGGNNGNISRAGFFFRTTQRRYDIY